jgi:HlyD family secretion protein
VKIRIKDKEAFRPGMSVTAEIETRSRTNVLTVPIQSVTTRLPKGKDGKPLATNAPPSGASGSARDKKANEGAKPVEVVFLLDGDKAKMVPVKLGISDENHTEIMEGLQEGQDVISGGYKAISRDLEDGKRIKIGEPEKEQKK